MGSLALAKEFKNRNKIIAHNKTHLLCARLGLLLNDRTVTVCKNVALRRRDIFSWGSLGDCRPRNRQPLQTHAYLRLHSSPGFLCVFFCIVFFLFFTVLSSFAACHFSPHFHFWWFLFFQFGFCSVSSCTTHHFAFARAQRFATLYVCCCVVCTRHSGYSFYKVI